MRFRIGLALYMLAASRRTVPPAPQEAAALPRRPPGALLWVHVPTAGGLPAAAEMLRHLDAEDPDLGLLVTGAAAAAPEDARGAEGAAALPEAAILQPAPAPTAAAVRAFLDHWRPDVAVQVAGPLLPPLVHRIHTAGLPFYLVEAERPTGGALRWMPGLAPGVLRPFRRILSPDSTTTRALRRLGGAAVPAETSGHMETGSGALPCTEAEREAMARILLTRPVWLAAALPENEVRSVIEAHRNALRLAHRLLLIVVPEKPEMAPALAARFAEEPGWTVACRSAEEDPEDDCQVYIADTEGEFGLWYRLAPITYLGGSLLGPGALRAPGEPAALGSAILHGPRAGAHAASFEALREARAARQIRNAAELGEAVGDLLSPDRAALLAHNAWAVTSSGAEVTTRVVAMLRQAVAEAQAGEREAAGAPAPGASDGGPTQGGAG